MSDAELRARALDAADDVARGLEPASPVSAFQLGCAALDHSHVTRTSYGLACPNRPVPVRALQRLSVARLRGLDLRLRGVPDLPETEPKPGRVDEFSWTIEQATWAAAEYERNLLHTAGLLDSSETEHVGKYAPISEKKREAQQECISFGLAHLHGRNRIRRTALGHLAARTEPPTLGVKLRAYAELKGRAA